MPEPRLFSIKEAAVYLGYPSEGALRMAISRRVIPPQAVVVLGPQAVRLDRKELDRFITKSKGRRNKQPPYLKKQSQLHIPGGGRARHEKIIAQTVKETMDRL
jgi:hypothetical protein